MNTEMNIISAQNILLLQTTLNSKLFIIQNPVAQYKQDKLKMSARDGADIIFKENTGAWTELLIWKN